MNYDDDMLEVALSDLAPSRLDPQLFGRLHGALEEASSPVDATDVYSEGMLAAYRPAPLTDSLKQRLVDATVVKAIPMPVASDRIIPFRHYAVAAVIALAGAAAALIAPIRDARSPAMADVDVPSPAIPTSAAREFVPAGYVRGLSDARDEGLLWKDDAPHRVLRIVYTDTITLRNEAGEIVEVEQPRVEYIVVPSKID